MITTNDKLRNWGATIVLVIRYVLGVLFLYSALPKIRQPYDFLASVYQYEILGPKMGMMVAIVLPWFELLAGISLLGGIFVKGALLGTTIMGVVFAYGISMALIQGLSISCGCFSATGGDRVGYLTLIRVIAILVASLAAYFGSVYGYTDVGSVKNSVSSSSAS